MTAILEIDTGAETSVIKQESYEDLKGGKIQILELPVSNVEIETALKGKIQKITI